MPELDQNLIRKLFHMGERCPADFERPAPEFKNVTQLSDPAIFDQFEKLVKEIIKEDDQEVALLGSRVLKDLLKQYPQLRQSSPELFGRYLVLLALLRFINLSVPGLPEISELIRNHLVDALRAGIPVVRKFEDVLDSYDDVLLGGEISALLGKALVDSNIRIGREQLILGKEKRTAAPTLGNWLIDYRIMIGADRGGAMERITYLNQSENVRKLSKSDQDLLKHVLKIYDWLRFGTPVEDLTRDKIPDQSLPRTRSGVRDGQSSRMKIPPSTLEKPLTIDELKREIVQTETVQRQSAPSQQPSAFTEEIKREVATSELPAHMTAPKPPEGLPTRPIGSIPLISPIRPITPIKPIVPTPPKPSPTPPQSTPVREIRFVDDLRKIDLSYLKGDLKTPAEGEARLRRQISNIKNQISRVASANHMYIHDALVVFQQSPLFGLYLKTGTMLMHNPNPDRKKAYEEVSARLRSEGEKTLTLAEFEAVADLKKELERM